MTDLAPRRHRAPRHVVALAFALLLAGSACRSAAPKPPVTTASPPAAPASATTVDPKREPEGIRWMRDSAEYHAIVLQTYRAATAHVEQAAAGRAPGSWAVVLDADETVINNQQYQVERWRARLPFTAESWKAWVARREATPLPGAAAFLARVRALGGRVAIVTNRLESECADTRVVFETHRLVYDAMLCRPDGGPSDKNPRFEAVAAGAGALGGGPLDVVAFLGDNIQDFPGLRQEIRQKGDSAFEAFGVRFFVLPNSMYGSWS